MSKEIIHTALLAAAFLALFGLAELLYHYGKVKAELTRKLVHVGTGVLTLLFPVLLSSHWPVLFLCASFAVILLFSLKYKLLPSINAIDRESVGSIAYPVSVFGCFLMFEFHDRNFIFFYLPILVLAICDPVAALSGRRWPMGKYKIRGSNKTLLGSFMFFISAGILCASLVYSLNGPVPAMRVIAFAFVTGLVSSVTEAVSGKGYDNITIPASVLLVLELFQNHLQP